MADFCVQCAPDLGGLVGIAKIGWIAPVICECCGHTWVDSQGNCVYKRCICRDVESGVPALGQCMNPGAHTIFDKNNPGNTSE